MNFQNILKDVSSDKGFWFRKGIVVHNIYELSREIETLDDFNFKYHCNDNHDDFANWIGGALGDIWLSERLRKVKNQARYVRIINSRIKHLEHKSMITHLRNIFITDTIQWFKDANVIVKLIITFLILLSIFNIYTQYQSLNTVTGLNNKLFNLEQRDACFDSYLDQKITLTQKGIMENSTLSQIQCQKNYSFNILNDFESTKSRISLSDINVNDNFILINKSHTSWAVFSNTSSMLPTLNHNTKAIEIVPKDYTEITVGDIISYSSNKEIIIHRVINTGNDSEGFYAVTKGDNNLQLDPEKVRFDQIQGVVVALIY